MTDTVKSYLNYEIGKKGFAISETGASSLINTKASSYIFSKYTGVVGDWLANGDTQFDRIIGDTINATVKVLTKISVKAGSEEIENIAKDE